MCLTCLPCIGASAWAGVKVSKSVDRAFSSKKPEEPIEPSFVTEAKLRWNLVSNPSAAAPSESQRPRRSDRYSSKELASKQRLAELVESHKAGSRAPAAQSTRR